MNISTGGSDPASGGVPASTALADFIVLNEEIAALVRARLPLEYHLKRLGAELPGRVGALAEQVGGRLEAGETLASAVEAECASLPAAYRAAIVAGIESGELGSALESLVDSASRLDELRRVTSIALVYPLIIFVVACMLLALMIGTVGPGFEWLDSPYFAPMRWLGQLPWIVPTLAIVVPGAVVVGAAVWWWRSGRVSGVRGFGSLAWLPLARSVRRWSDAATFADVLLLVTQRGLPLDRALKLAAGATNDSRLRAASEEYAQAIQQGDAAGKAGGDQAKLGRDFPMLIRLALHHSGDRALMAGGLRQAATMYRERAVRAAEWYAEYLPLIFTVVIGGTLTFAFTLLVIWPYAATLHALSTWNWGWLETPMVENANTLRDEQLSSLVQAVGAAAAGQVPLEMTLGALAEEKDDPQLARIARQLAGEVEKGVPIAEAAARLEGRLPTQVRGLLRAGVESGDLAGTFERYAQQKVATQRIGRRIRAAFAYPLLILTILVPLVLFITMYVVPMFREMFEDFDLVLPVITIVVLDAADKVPELIGGLLVFFVAVPVVLRMVGGRWLYHRIRTAVPLLGQLSLWSGQREFAAMLASFLDMRLPMISAVAHTGDVLSDRNLGAACRRLSGRLQGGQTLSECMSQSIHFDRSLVAMVAWGESQGLLPEALKISTAVFDDRVEQHASLIHRLLPPVMLIAVGLMLGFVVIGLMVPLVDLIRALSM